MATRTLIVDSGAVTRLVSRWFIIDSGNVARLAKRGFIIDSGNTARLIFSGFTPVTNTYTSGTGATETVPTGAVQCGIELEGGGAAGGKGVKGGGGVGGGCSFDEKR